MKNSPLKILDDPALLAGARMVVAFSGWMDGGDVSTGTVKLLVRQLQAQPVAQINPENFYIYNFPGAMEVAAMFRPMVKIDEGLITELQMPTNTFFSAPRENLLLFVGKEPNLHWESFGKAMFEMANKAKVSQIFFVGSFAGSVPHTREPRLYGSVSDATLKPFLKRYGLRFSTYEGPASFASYLTMIAPDHDVQMLSLVAEIPGYVEGSNPPSIAAITKRLAVMLGLQQVTSSELRDASDEWETRVSAAVAKDEDLQNQIRELEEQYDDDLIEQNDEATGG